MIGVEFDGQKWVNSSEQVATKLLAIHPCQGSTTSACRFYFQVRFACWQNSITRILVRPTKRHAGKQIRHGFNDPTAFPEFAIAQLHQAAILELVLACLAIRTIFLSYKFNHSISPMKIKSPQAGWKFVVQPAI